METEKTENPFRTSVGATTAHALRKMTGIPAEWVPERPDEVVIDVMALRRWLRDRGF